MSKIKVNRLENTSTANGGIDIDTSGHVQVDGLQMPTAGALSNRNLIINGDHRVHQRGTSVSLTDSNATFLTDRFQAYESTGGSLDMANVAEGPDNFVNSTKITVTSADTSLSTGQQSWIRHRVEGNNIAHLNWGSSAAQTVTLSFYVRSSVTGSFSVSLQNLAGNRVYPVLYTISAANTWERKTITIPGETSGTWGTDNGTGITIYWSFGMASNVQGTPGQWSSSSARTATGETQLIATNGATFYLTGVQLEVGSKATPFEHESYGQTLAKCQRYYYRSDLAATAGTHGFFGVLISGAPSVSVGSASFPVTMRLAPDVDIPYGYDQSGVVAGGGATAGAIGVNGFIRLNKTSGNYSTNGTPISANFTASAEL